MYKTRRTCSLSLFVILYVVSVFTNDIVNNNPDNYGPYKIDLSTHRVCKGPKKYDVTLFDLKSNNSLGHYNFTFLESTVLDEIRLTMYSVMPGQKKVLFRYSIKKPCQHFVVAEIIYKSFNTTNCFIKKGKYVYTLNFDEYATLFWGKSFFYGTYEVKEIVLSKNSNIMCAVTTAKVLKK